MTWLFQWDWLGFLWVILLGGQLSALAGMFASELVSAWKNRDSQQEANRLIDMMAMAIVCTSILLGLLTTVVWDFRTALWLVIAVASLLAMIFGVAYSLMKQISKETYTPSNNLHQ